MLKDAAADLAVQLEAAGLGLTRARNLFVGPIPADETNIPGAAVFLLGTGGNPPAPFLGGNRTGIAEPTVQVRIRGDREGFQAAQTLAFGVFGALHETVPAGYISVLARESEPYYLGEDASGRSIFVFNVEVAYQYGP